MHLFIQHLLISTTYHTLFSGLRVGQPTVDTWEKGPLQAERTVRAKVSGQGTALKEEQRGRDAGAE